MPSFTGHNWLLTGFQGVGLWLFTGLAARYGPPGRHMVLFALWILVQTLTLVLANRINPTAVEQTIPLGFAMHREWLELHYTGNGLRMGSVPPGWTLPIQGLLGSVGSWVTGGLLGSLLLADAVNRMGLGASVLANDILANDPAGVGHFLWNVIPWGFVALMLGISSMHLSLTPWLWQWRAAEPVQWPLQRPLLFAGIALASLGLVLLVVWGSP